jgi:tetratricopeptide (TPR) repeat protein
MVRIVIVVVILLALVSAPAHAWAANEYYDRALKSSTAMSQIKYLSKALALDPGLAAAYAKRGLIYYFQERYEQMVEDYQSYTRLAPWDADGHRMLGMGYLRKGMYRQAVSSFNQALAEDPRLVSALTYRAEANRLSGKEEAAILDATRAIETGGDPRTIADAYVTRAKVYREMGRQEESLADVRASLQVDPRYVFYRYIAGYASLEAVRRMGMFAIIALAFVAIFKVRITPPKKGL